MCESLNPLPIYETVTSSASSLYGCKSRTGDINSGTLEAGNLLQRTSKRQWQNPLDEELIKGLGFQRWCIQSFQAHQILLLRQAIRQHWWGPYSLYLILRLWSTTFWCRLMTPVRPILLSPSNITSQLRYHNMHLFHFTVVWKKKLLAGVPVIVKDRIGFNISSQVKYRCIAFSIIYQRTEKD